MPSILDYLDNPQFLSSVIGGGTTDSFGPQQPPQPPPPPSPPPDIMAQAPKQFGPGAAVDGGTGPADSFSARFSPGPEPISMPEPTKAKYEGGIFGGLGFKPLGWDDQPPAPGPQQSPGPDQQPGSALAFAGAPQTRNGFPYEAPPAVQRPPPMEGGRPIENVQSQVAWPNLRGVQQANQPTTPIINRTPRNGMSLDDAQLDRPTPVGNPMDIRSPAQSGQPAPRIDRARAFGNFVASLGKGLTAVGNQKPGTTGAAAFAGGAGGALEGYSEAERHNLDRDERGLDRAERGRERNQTFDYQNRTLAANTKYHDDLVQQHKLDRDERAGRERYYPVGQTADGNIVYQDRNSPGNEIVGDNKVVSRTGAGNQGGANERLARIIQAEHGKDENGNFKITMEEANNRARSAPKDSADILRREQLARRDLKEHEDRRRRDEPRKTLEDFRRELGLPPAPPPPPQPTLPGTPPLGTRRGVDPDRTLPPPALPSQGVVAPGVPQAVPRQVTPNLVPRGPTPSPAPPFNPGPLPPSPTVGAGAPAQAPGRPVPMSAAPPRPPQVPPGSQYSPSRNAWRAPDGTIIPGQPPQ